jgi:hypothetical protein
MIAKCHLWSLKGVLSQRKENILKRNINRISNQQVNAAIANIDWDLGNKILYDMCKKYPWHKEKSEIIAKVWLIGRSYAAAIERRRHTKEEIFDSADSFYVKKVAPMILKSDIDTWLYSLKDISTELEKNLGIILKVHLQVTVLFYSISGLEKRSLASKYLHFHYPGLFFIYDSSAVLALSKLSNITGRVGRSKYKESDNEYRKFCEKCLKIRDFIRESYCVNLTPRGLDKLLLLY